MRFAILALLLLAGCAPKHQHERVAYHARLTSDRMWAVDVEADDGCVLLTFYLPSPHRTPSVVMPGRGWGENIWNSADGDTFYSDTLHADTTRYRRVVP